MCVLWHSCEAWHGRFQCGEYWLNENKQMCECECVRVCVCVLMLLLKLLLFLLLLLLLLLLESGTKIIPMCCGKRNYTQLYYTIHKLYTSYVK